MSIYVLGISCFYHDSAACILKDGRIIAAAQEERFTRIKHDPGFPDKAINYCLNESKISKSDLNFIAFYDKPWIKFERILESYLAFAPKGIRSFLMAMPVWLKEKLRMDKYLKEKFGDQSEFIFTEHHESHAASAFFPSPFKNAAILTLDGVGEWTTSSMGIGESNKIKLISEIKFPHSLGLLYSAFTYYLGFRVNSGEYKVMGLAPYGEPNYTKIILDNLIDLKEDGSFKLNMEYFNYCSGLTMTSKKFDILFGGLPREPESALSQKEMDLAASIQKVTEEIMLRMAGNLKNITGMKNLCLSGGVALNCVGNGKILREKIFDNIWIQPAAGDAGGALGAALIVWHHFLNQDRMVTNQDQMSGSFLGPNYSDDEIENVLLEKKIKYKKYSRPEIPVLTAGLIQNQNVVGWFQGRMEFGPRALGSRSIVGDARSPEMQSIMNLKIKFRESFRPFAPSVLEEKSKDYFGIDVSSPYMLLVADVKKERRKDPAYARSLKGIEKLNLIRSQIPAVTHVDYSARLHTVNKETNELYYEMINEFYKLTSCPVIINTSFNVRGEPIVCSPEDAVKCFLGTEMDYLVIGNFIVSKKDNSDLALTFSKKEIPLD